jgi:multidrug resistance efflux pump
MLDASPSHAESSRRSTLEPVLEPVDGVVPSIEETAPLTRRSYLQVQQSGLVAFRRSPVSDPAGPEPSAPGHETSPPPASRPPFPYRQWMFRGLRLAIGATVLVGASQWLMQRQQVVVSRQGFINGTLLDVQSPMTGELRLANLRAGDPVQAGQVIGTVKNPRNPQLEIDRQTFEAQVSFAQTELQTLIAKRRNRQAQLQRTATDSVVQKSVQSNYDDQRLSQLRTELDQAKQTKASADREYARMQSLVDEGIMPRMQADQAQDAVQQAELAISAKQSQIQQARSEKAAAQKGWQIDAARSLSYVEQRRREVETDLADLELDIANAQTRLTQAQLAVSNLKAQLKIQKQAPVKAPMAGIVWSVEAKGSTQFGKPVNANEGLLKVLDCQDTWVEAFVSEKDLDAIRVGMPVTIDRLGQPGKLQGRIAAVRAGMGRVAVGNEVAVPPDERARREVGLQVTWLDRPQAGADQFCGVGQSVEVSFQKTDAPLGNRLGQSIADRLAQTPLAPLVKSWTRS